MRLRADAPAFVPGARLTRPRRRRPSASAKRAWRRLLDEQFAMAREDPRRRRVEVTECVDTVSSLSQAHPAAVVEDEDALSSSSSSSDDEDEVATMIEEKRWPRVRIAARKKKFRSSARLVESATTLDAPLDVLESLAMSTRRGGRGCRALFIACEKCDSGATDVLLKCGFFESSSLFGVLTRRRRTSIDAILRVFEKHGVLHEALRARSRKRGMQTLLHAAACGARRCPDEDDNVKTLVEFGADPLCLDGRGKSAVMYAVERNAPQVVAALLSVSTSRVGRHDLVDALVEAASSRDKFETLQALLAGRVAIDLDGRSAAHKGETALCGALSCGNLEAAALLASPDRRRRCSLRRKNQAGLSPLYVACEFSSRKAVELLFDADITLARDCAKPATRPDGLSLFVGAMKRGAWDIAACMAENNVSLSKQERDDPFILRRVFAADDDDEDETGKFTTLAFDKQLSTPPRRAFSEAMRHLLVSQMMCDAVVVGCDTESWEIGVHSFVLPERMFAVPNGTSRRAAMAALVYYYSGQLPREEEEDCAVAAELVELAKLWGLHELSRKALRRIVSKQKPFAAAALVTFIPSDCFDGAALRKTGNQRQHDALFAARSPFYAAMLEWYGESVALDAPEDLLDVVLDHVHGIPVKSPSSRRSTDLLLHLARFADMYMFSDLRDEVDAMLASRAEKKREDLLKIFETAHALGLRRTMRYFLKLVLFDKTVLDAIFGQKIDDHRTFRLADESTTTMTKNQLVASVLRACQTAR